MMEAEERPIADRIDGIPHPAEAETLIGHDGAMERLAQSYKSGRFHHAWLLSGPRGIGKATLAFRFAKHMLSFPNPTLAPETYDSSAVDHSVSRQIAQGAHPNLLHLTKPWDEKTKKFKTQLSVEEVRRTSAFYGMTAGAGGWRVTIVDAADDMNASAANALLKILEEPPKRSVFFVITHAAGGLLPTIRSRCQALACEPLSPPDVKQALNALSVQASDQDLEAVAHLSEGSVRRAIQLIESDVTKDFASFERLMSNPNRAGGGDWVAVHKIADSLSRRGQEESYGLFFDLVNGWIAKQVRDNPTRSPAALAAWANAWEKATQSQKVADAFNLDKKQVILSLFVTLFECKDFNNSQS